MGKIRNDEYPLYEVAPVSCIRQLLEDAVRDAGDRIAFKYKEADGIREVTYRAFYDDVLALGTALTRTLGVSGAHIACVSENRYAWITAYLTVLKSNGVFVPVDKELPVRDMCNVLTHSDSEVLFYSARYEDLLKDKRAALPNIRYFIGFDREENEGVFLSYARLIEEGRALLEGGDTVYATMQGDVNALRMLVYTSGTTGLAKGVMLSEHNLVSCVYHGLRVSRVYDVCLSILPYHHTYEAVTGILNYLHQHATICINESLKNVSVNFRLYKPEYVNLVPAFVEVFYKRIWATAKKQGKDKSLALLIKTSDALRRAGVDQRRKLFAQVHEIFGGNLKKIVCGGAPIRPELGEFFESIGIPLINGYGITECSPLVSVNRDEFNDPSTVGRILPCCKLRFDDVSPDGEGEICVRGDIVMLGYYKNPEQTAEVFAGKFFRTGDYGRLNDKGQLVITGRKKNLIVLNNGKNIFPEEIENYIYSVPYVKEAVVYAVKDEGGTDATLGAEVYLDADRLREMNIPEDKAEGTLKKDVARACAALPSYKHVGTIVIRSEEFEKTTTNKIKRSSGYFNRKEPTDKEEPKV